MKPPEIISTERLIPRQSEPGEVHYVLQQPAPAPNICRKDAGHDLLRQLAAGAIRRMKPALPTAPAAYGLNGPSATVTVDNATTAGLHLSQRKICPNKRGQLSIPFHKAHILCQ